MLLACLATLGVHLLSLTRQLGLDEGGFAMVSRYWGTGGPFLYGPQWVDRPPGLIALFDLAQRLGPFGVRLTAGLLAVALVGAVARAADAAGGRRAARWAAWTGFAFGSSALLDAHQLNGELAAATCVAVSVAALLRAWGDPDSRTRRILYAFLAGVAAIVAVLMKQNFVDAFVFAAVLLAVSLGTPSNRLVHRPRTVLSTASGFAAGALVPGAATLVWAAGHGGTGALAYAMFGFRADAAATMASWDPTTPLHRLESLVELGLLSGLLLLAGHLAHCHWRRLRRLDPLTSAVAVTVVVELLGVFAGENFWPHYLIALIPMVALAAGTGVHRWAPGWQWTRRLVVLSAVVTTAAAPVAGVTGVYAFSQSYTTGRWVSVSARPTDTLVVPFSHANVIDAAGLEPGYPYSWSLPVRALDPDLSLLTATMNGAQAPTWVVRWDDPHSWGLDPANRVDAALRSHYSSVAVVCGHTVWLHDGVRRSLAPTPSAAACETGPR